MATQLTCTVFGLKVAIDLQAFLTCILLSYQHKLLVKFQEGIPCGRLTADTSCKCR